MKNVPRTSSLRSFKNQLMQATHRKIAGRDSMCCNIAHEQHRYSNNTLCSFFATRLLGYIATVCGKEPSCGKFLTALSCKGCETILRRIIPLVLLSIPRCQVPKEQKSSKSTNSLQKAYQMIISFIHQNRKLLFFDSCRGTRLEAYFTLIMIMSRALSSTDSTHNTECSSCLSCGPVRPLTIYILLARFCDFVKSNSDFL